VTLSPRPRVCFFNRSYWPDTGATGQLLTELAEDLVRDHGFDVTVVAGAPRTTPGAPAREVRNGVTVIRARGTTFSPRRFPGRAANYLSYFASASFAAWRLPRQDVVVAMTDPPIIGLTALAFRRGARFVWYCQDVFPEVAAVLEDFRSTRVDRALEMITRRIARHAHHVVAIGETMAERLITGKGADPSRVAVIHNWADRAAFSDEGKNNPFAIAHGLSASVVVLHGGNIGLSQQLDSVIVAAEKLRDRRDIVFLFVGDGARRGALADDVTRRGLRNVRFVDYQPRDQMPWTYATADLCIVSLKQGLAGYIVPSKLYTILAAGRAYVAAVESDSEVAHLTREHACGLVVPPGDAGRIAGAVLQLADDAELRQVMGSRARAASANYTRDRQVALHAGLLRELATGSNHVEARV
jgi:glycosyltransferase involved in cell wall biosynthesis